VDPLGAREGHAPAAAELQGFVDASYAAAGQRRQLAERKVYEITLAVLRGSMPEDDLGRRMAEGASWREDEALAFALNRLVYAGASANQPTPG
jgi:hypothetical protein